MLSALFVLRAAGKQTRNLAIVLLSLVTCYLMITRKTPLENRHDHTREDDLTRVTAGIKLSKFSDQPCTFALFRRYFKDYNYLPGGGRWYTDTAVPYFQPDFCKFKRVRMNRTMIAQCLSESNIKSVMTLGDSNAQRYFESFKRSVANKTKCFQVRREGMLDSGLLPDKKFYQPKNGTVNEWENFIEVNYRFCHGCGGQQYICSTSANPVQEIALAHVSMVMLLDDTIQIHVRSIYEVNKLRKYWSPTSQETLFKHFLKGRYPDVFFMFLPFNHAKQLKNDRLYLDLQYCLGLVRHYFPKHTKGIFMPTFSEFELPRKASEWVNVTFDDMLAADKIDHINHMMFDLVKDDLLNSQSNIYGFLDLFNISKPRMDWSLDGIHMQPQWYDIMVSILWETLCNSLRLDAF